jgi:hypothetical protein
MVSFKSAQRFLTSSLALGEEGDLFELFPEVFHLGYPV